MVELGMALFPDDEPPRPHPTAALYRYIATYEEQIRPCSPFDRTIAFKQIKRLLASGITEEQILTAIRLYANDPWRKGGDSRHSKSIRSFFCESTIREWQTPRPTRNPLSTVELKTGVRPNPDRFPTYHDEEEYEEL